MHGGRWFFRPIGSDGNAADDGRRTGNETENTEDSAGSQEEIDWHKIIWEEYFPIAFAIGISVEEFKHLTPRKLGYCLKGHKLERKMRDEEMWLWFGTYGISAVSAAIQQCFGKSRTKPKYIEKPILEIEEEKKSQYTESQEEVAVYEMKQRIELLRQKGLPESPM